MSDEIEVDVVDESDKVYLTPEERYRINLSTEQFIVQERDKKIIELRLEVIRAQTELAKAQVIILSKDERGAPFFTLTPEAQKIHNIQTSSLSISHDGGFAIAVVAIEPSK